MNKCINILRAAVQDWKEPLNPAKWAWISIEEPDDKKSVVSNEVLEKLPHLKIAFWDLVVPVSEIGSAKIFFPPNEKDAFEIVQFILDNGGKNFLINCAAGVSRSAAVCAFLEKHLGYAWMEMGKRAADPNKLLVSLLEKEYDLLK